MRQACGSHHIGEPGGVDTVAVETRAPRSRQCNGCRVAAVSAFDLFTSLSSSAALRPATTDLDGSRQLNAQVALDRIEVVRHLSSNLEDDRHLSWSDQAGHRARRLRLASLIEWSRRGIAAMAKEKIRRHRRHLEQRGAGLVEILRIARA